MKTFKLFSAFLLLAFFTFSCQQEDIREENTPASSNSEDGPIESRDPGDWETVYKGNSTAYLYESFSDDGTSWCCDNQINPGSFPATDKSPGLITFNSQLFMFYRGNTGSNTLYFAVRNNISPFVWTGNTAISIAQGLDSGPSAVVFNNKLYVFYVSGTLITYVTSTDGVNFAGPFLIQPNPPIFAAKKVEPGVVVANGRIYVIYASTFNDEIFVVRSDNGTNWVGNFTGQSVFEATRDGVSAAFANGQINLAFTGQTTEKLYWKTANILSNGNLTWNSSSQILSASTNEKPAIAASKSGNLLITYKGKTSSSVFWARRNAGTSSWVGNSSIPNAETDRGPGLIFWE